MEALETSDKLRFAEKTAVDQASMLPLLRRASAEKSDFIKKVVVVPIVFVCMICCLLNLPQVPRFKAKLSKQLMMMGATELAAVAYASKHENGFPGKLDAEFEEEISAKMKVLSSKFSYGPLAPASPDWLTVSIVNDESGAIARAKQFLGIEQIIYCPVRTGNQITSFFVLGTGPDGALIGPCNKPIVLKPGR